MLISSTETSQKSQMLMLIKKKSFKRTATSNPPIPIRYATSKRASAHLFAHSQQTNASVCKEQDKFYKADRLVIAYVIDGYSAHRMND